MSTVRRRDPRRLGDRAVAAARPGLLAAADVLGRGTSARRALPGLLIVGGQRCGTTSMYKALVQQPTLFRPVWRKGVHYFDVGYDQGPNWYRGHFPLTAHLAASARRHATRALCFESSPYYLYHPLAAARIAETLPEVKLLVLVRDPVERAYSAHAHELARGFEELSFEEALDAEDERLSGEEERLRADPAYQSHAHRHQAYRARGEYAPQIRRLAGMVGPGQVKVVDSHRLFTTPDAVYAETLAWLGVRPAGPVRFERHNARPRTPLPERLRDRLERHYANFDDDLTGWLGHRPSWRVRERR